MEQKYHWIIFLRFLEKAQSEISVIQDLTLKFYAMFNGWKKIKDYNPDGEDNQQYATPDGMPSWFTLNWRGSVYIY